MESHKCPKKCSNKTENVIVYDYNFATINPNPCSKKIPVLYDINDSFQMVKTNETKCKKVCGNDPYQNDVYQDDECISLISENSYDSFDSWNEENILENEILRAKVEFKNNYNNNAKKCT